MMPSRNREVITPSTVILPVFISHRGCPHQCVFCNQKTIAGEAQYPTAEALKHRATVWKAQAGVAPELAFYGGSFTGIPVDDQMALLHMAQDLLHSGAIAKIRLSTRPDYLDPVTLKRLRDFDVACIEIGVQSFSDAVLQASGRGHDAQTTREAIRRVREAGFQCGAQLMVGLPQDTPECSLASAREAVKLGVDVVRIYPTVVLRETLLAEAFGRQEFTPWSPEEIITCCAEMVMVFEAADIPILRIGLQDTPQLHGEAAIVAGFHHPALGELVRSRVWRHRLEMLWHNSGRGTDLTVRGHSRVHSQLIGQKRCHVAYFQETHGVRFKVVDDDRLAVGDVEREVSLCI